MRPRRLASLFVAAVLAACGSGSTDVSSSNRFGGGAGAADPPGKPLAVMTRNLYVGGDLMLPFASQDPIGAASTVWADILASDVPGRMRAIALEVSAARPDLLGVQEAFRFVVTQLGTGTVLMDIDFLELLQGALESPGHWDGDDDGEDDDVPGIGRWRLAVAQEHTVLTVPFLDRGVAVTLIDRDAILVGPGVKIRAASGGDFAAEFVTTLAGAIPVHLKRGFTVAEVTRRAVPFTFVNVHLEEQELGPLQSVQAKELLARFGAVGPLVLAGDFNSDPFDPAYAASPAPIPTPYQLLSASGLVNVWDAVGVGTGNTWGFPGDLRPPGALTQRLDHVFLGGAIVPVAAFRVGLEPLAALDGRWPSDHAGLVARLRIQKPAEHEDEGEDDDRDGDRDGDCLADAGKGKGP
jgi:hypothetical protein